MNEIGKAASQNITLRKRGNHFSPEQNAILKELFNENTKPNFNEKLKCSQATGLNLKAVSSWFERQRNKSKPKRDGFEHNPSKRVVEGHSQTTLTCMRKGLALCQ